VKALISILTFSLCLGVTGQAGGTWTVQDMRAIVEKKQRETREKCQDVTRERIQHKNREHLDKMDSQQKEICTEELFVQEKKLCEERLLLFEDQLVMLTDDGLKVVLNGRSLSRETAGQQVQLALKNRVEKTKGDLANYISQAFERTRCSVLTGITGMPAKRALLKKLGEKSDAILKDQMRSSLVLD
jgi:hypothetical protein